MKREFVERVATRNLAKRLMEECSYEKLYACCTRDAKNQTSLNKRNYIKTNEGWWFFESPVDLEQVVNNNPDSTNILSFSVVKIY